MGVIRQNIIPERKGTSQRSRLSEKLLPSYFSVDERKLNDFLAFLKEFAGEIDFHQGDQSTTGGDRQTWRNFFTKDISVIIASIISIDIDTIDRGFEFQVQRVSSSYDPKDKLIIFEELFAYVLGVAGKLPDWHKEIEQLFGLSGSIENEVELELLDVIDQKLSGALRGLNTVVQQGKEVGILLHHQEIPYPGYGVREESGEMVNVFRGESLNSMLETGMVFLRSVYHVVYNALVYCRKHFLSHFEISLTEKHNHEPDVALLIVFLRLFKYAQADLNEITLRHLEYYYRSILLQDNRPPLSDSLYVCFELVRNAHSCTIPKGRTLFAGRNDNSDFIFYETTDSVHVTKASVHALKSVFISRVLEGQTWTYKLVTGIYGAPVSNSKDGLGAPFHDSAKDWPLFGEEQYKSGRKTMEYADLGFAVSSPMLLLKEGKRQVKFHIQFSEKPDAEGTYQKLVEDLKEGNDEDDLHTALFEVFGRGRDFAFKVMISTTEGWLDVADVASNNLYMESRPWSWNRFTIGFTIPASVPPIVPMPNEGFSNRFPTVKFILNPQKTPFPYTFLETLIFEAIEMEVQVERVKDLVVFNDLGKLDSSQPFQALGPIPQVGSYTLIGNAEVFRKPLKYIRFHIDWQNLPSKGLQDYYKEYFEKDIEITEDNFKIHLTALSGYQFKPEPEDDVLEYRLFPEDPTTTHTYVELADPRRLSIRPNPDIGEVADYDKQTPIGFFKLELKEPKLAFGHSLYQERMSEVALNNSDLEADSQMKYPNTPFTPIVKDIELNYRAEDKIVFEQYDPTSRNNLYHIHPFGIAPVYSRGNLQAKVPTMIPEYHHDGYLYIALKDLQPPQEISLLFQLAASRTTFSSQLPHIEWSYLTSMGWEEIRTIDLISDTTENFTKTGIVKLRIPSECSSSNPILPTGVHWLRVSVSGRLDGVSRAVDVLSQAVRADWVQDPEDLGHLEQPMEALKVRSLYEAMPEIKSVTQPYASFGSRTVEDRGHFFQRVSERLRHKNRSISHFDYERLILNHFHSIMQVKCLSQITHPEYVLPGELRIVVVPGLNNQSTNILTPKVNHGTLLEIEEYLSEHASPFAIARVSNPSYEYIRVNCRVKFANRQNNGESLEKLRGDIQDFICPWLKSDPGEIEIGGSLRVEDLFKYIKGLPYVDFVTKFAVLHFFIEDEHTGVYQLKSTADPRLSENERSFIRAQKPWSVLIPDLDHEIEFTERELHVSPEFNLEPVDFQGRFQISPHLIKILPKKSLAEDNPDIRYDQEDTIRIFVDVPEL